MARFFTQWRLFRKTNNDSTSSSLPLRSPVIPNQVFICSSSSSILVFQFICIYRKVSKMAETQVEKGFAYSCVISQYAAAVLRSNVQANCFGLHYRKMLQAQWFKTNLVHDDAISFDEMQDFKRSNVNSDRYSTNAKLERNTTNSSNFIAIKSDTTLALRTAE